ncbi:hypothetical protein [Nostoc flagelliforme]|uniref:hypothetical protein n=1 Tax=Nostoc flagelliforme TaxID=1306274 RepID=UPI0012FD0120|nr:hypothetical protein [Nostoc flagelliforme]
MSQHPCRNSSRPPKNFCVFCGDRILIVPPPNANWNFALLRNPPYRQPRLAGYAHIQCPRQESI